MDFLFPAEQGNKSDKSDASKVLAASGTPSRGPTGLCLVPTQGLKKAGKGRAANCLAGTSRGLAGLSGRLARRLPSAPEKLRKGKPVGSSRRGRTASYVGAVRLPRRAIRARDSRASCLARGCASTLALPVRRFATATSSPIRPTRQGLAATEGLKSDARRATAVPASGQVSCSATSMPGQATVLG